MPRSLAYEVDAGDPDKQVKKCGTSLGRLPPGRLKNGSQNVPMRSILETSSINPQRDVLKMDGKRSKRDPVVTTVVGQPLKVPKMIPTQDDPIYFID